MPSHIRHWGALHLLRPFHLSSLAAPSFLADDRYGVAWGNEIADVGVVYCLMPTLTVSIELPVYELGFWSY
jgi:hypothetical protein